MFLSRIFKSNSLSKKILANILFASSLITCLITISQLAIEYNKGLQGIDLELKIVKNTHFKSLSFALWSFNKKQANSIITGIELSPNINYIEIIDSKTNFKTQAGTKGHYKEIISETLYYTDPSMEKFEVGKINIHIDHTHLIENLKDSILIILFSQSMKTFLVSFFILWMLNHIFIKDLKTISEHLLNYNLKGKHTILKLNRNSGHDELDNVVDVINSQTQHMRKLYNKLKVQNDTLEEQIILRTQKVTELKEKNENLLKVVCHDLATPVTMVASSVKKLKRILESDNPKIGKLFDSIFKNTEREVNILNSVRTMAAAESGSIELKTETSYLRPLLDNANTSLGPKIRDKNITVNIVEEAKDLCALVDKAIFVDNILCNLISNAIKFTPKDGKIELKLSKKEKVIYISVTNFGVAIPEEIRNALFKSKPVVSTNGTSGEKGTGFGLLIVDLFIKAHNARVEVYSDTINPKTEFRIIIPEATPKNLSLVG